MANKKLYSIQDVKAQECLNVVMLKNHVEAERFFQMVVENPQSPVSRYPRDYKVLSIGEIDSETGEVKGSIPRDVTPYTWLDSHMSKRNGVNDNAASA